MSACRGVGAVEVRASMMVNPRQEEASAGGDGDETGAGDTDRP